MDLAFLESMSADPSYVKKLHPRLWLMDDHRWAFYAWVSSLRPLPDREHCTLAHLDYHFDTNNDYICAADMERLLQVADPAAFQDIVGQNNLIKCDSFIVPAILRGLVRDVHFFCRNVDPDPGIYEEWLDTYDGPQFYHQRLENLLLALEGESVLFDLCLDLFNNMANKRYRGDLWPDAEILELIDSCSELIRTARLITVSLSFRYSGSEADTRHLAMIVLPKILQHLGAG